jgi:hypothetical protein
MKWNAGIKNRPGVCPPGRDSCAERRAGFNAINGRAGRIMVSVAGPSGSISGALAVGSQVVFHERDRR